MQRIEHLQAGARRLADAGEQLDRFRRLQRPDGSGERREHAHHCAGHLLGLAALGEQARVAGRVVPAQVEYGELPVEPDRGARNQGLGMLHARAVERVARGEIVAAVENHVGGCDEPVELRPLQPRGKRDDFDVGVHFVERRACRCCLGCAYRPVAIEDLALQVRRVDLVAIGNGELADAACREVERSRAAQAPGADDQGVAGKEALLRFDAELLEQDVPAVAQQLRGKI